MICIEIETLENWSKVSISQQILFCICTLTITSDIIALYIQFLEVYFCIISTENKRQEWY